MKTNKSVRYQWMLLAATAVSAIAAEDSSLLNMLQKKGLLTEAEINSIRGEQKAAAASAKPAPSNWAAHTKISGDLRGRFEGLYADNPSFQDRNRFRYRLRASLTSVMSEQFEVGLRLQSGEAAAGGIGGDPISGNASFQDNASKKLLFVDLAYGKWRELQSDAWNAALTLGKIENPFVFSDLVFDHDYTPEGFGQQISAKLNDQHTLGLNLGGFVLDGIGALERDAFLGGAQARLDSAWNKNWQSSAGLAALVITGEEQLVNGAVPNQNRGNRRPAANASGPGALTARFAPVVTDASVTYSVDSVPFYPGKFPIKFGGDYLFNHAVDTRNQAASIGVTFGKAGKKGQWDLGYRWKYLEGDAWYEELVDSDFGAFYRVAPDAGGAAGYGAGTNVRGHVLKANYSVTDGFSLGATAFLSELIQSSRANADSGFTRVQFDVTWKF